MALEGFSCEDNKGILKNVIEIFTNPQIKYDSLVLMTHITEV